MTGSPPSRRLPVLQTRTDAWPDGASRQTILASCRCSTRWRTRSRKYGRKTFRTTCGRKPFPKSSPLQRKNKRFLRSRNSIRSFPFRQTTSRKERSSASTAIANLCTKCATARACTAAILQSCKSWTATSGLPKSCSRPEPTNI